MQTLLFVFGAAACLRARVAVHRTALIHGVQWGMAAWCGWGLAIFLDGLTTLVPASNPSLPIYGALCLTGCAAVAVLGARRPQAAAWNFVVVGLLAVMFLPLAEEAIIGTHSLDWMRIAFLGVTLGIGLVNYLPTRFGPAAFLAAIACAAELIALAAPRGWQFSKEADMIRLCLLAAPGLALAMWRCFPSDQASELDRMWRDFRDRWGLVWAQRVREQFNRVAANAGWPVTLTWSGFTFQQQVDAATRAAIRDALSALLRRFVDAKSNAG